jgi:glycosyltransferase involved in cell wall biosynthesis
VNKISCILTTGHRRSFFNQAIRCYDRQTWPNKELVVVDDGEGEVVVPEGARYIRVPTGTSIGAKLNLGCEAAKGSILQKLDDDDYYRPDFIERMMKHSTQYPLFITGPGSFLILLAREGRLVSSGGGFFGGSMMFPKQVWQNRPFNEAVPVGEDKQFMRDNEMVPRLTIPDAEIMMVVRHTLGHKWEKHYGRNVEQFFGKNPDYPKTLAGYLESPEDLSFYEGLIESSKSASSS